MHVFGELQFPLLKQRFGPWHTSWIATEVAMAELGGLLNATEAGAVAAGRAEEAERARTPVQTRAGQSDSAKRR